jgi:hypothetical protein
MRHGDAAEGLEAGCVHVETELAIAEGNLAGQIIPYDIVACDEGVAVDWSGG